MRNRLERRSSDRNNVSSTLIRWKTAIIGTAATPSHGWAARGERVKVERGGCSLAMGVGRCSPSCAGRPCARPPCATAADDPRPVPRPRRPRRRRPRPPRSPSSSSSQRRRQRQLAATIAVVSKRATSAVPVVLKCRHTTAPVNSWTLTAAPDTSLLEGRAPVPPSSESTFARRLAGDIGASWRGAWELFVIELFYRRSFDLVYY